MVESQGVGLEEAEAFVRGLASYEELEGMLRDDGRAEEFVEGAVLVARVYYDEVRMREERSGEVHWKYDVQRRSSLTPSLAHAV